MKEKVIEKIPERKDLDRRQERFLEANIFLGKFLLVGAVFHLILFTYPDTSALQSVYAGFITELMNLLGFSFSHSSVFILAEGGGYEITQDCLGWKSMMAFTGLVYATPGSVRSRLKALGAGVLLIAVANVVRIVTTIYLSWLGIIEFEVIHGFLWKWSLTGVVLGSWLAWMRFRD